MMAALRENDAATVDRTLLADLRLTHRSAKLERYALALGQLLPRLLGDPEPRIGRLACEVAESLGFRATQVVQRIKRNGLSDLDVIGGLLSPACYIEHSFPAVLYLAARYADELRGRPSREHERRRRQLSPRALLGAILGAAPGISSDSRHGSRPSNRAELEEEIESFIARFA